MHALIIESYPSISLLIFFVSFIHPISWAGNTLKGIKPMIHTQACKGCKDWINVMCICCSLWMRKNCFQITIESSHSSSKGVYFDGRWTNAGTSLTPFILGGNFHFSKKKQKTELWISCCSNNPHPGNCKVFVWVHPQALGPWRHPFLHISQKSIPKMPPCDAVQQNLIWSRSTLHSHNSARHSTKRVCLVTV